MKDPEPGSGLVDARAAALFLSATGRPVQPGTIRQWARRGLVERCGKDRQGRVLYRLDELVARAGKESWES